MTSLLLLSVVGCAGSAPQTLEVGELPAHEATANERLRSVASAWGLEGSPTFDVGPLSNDEQDLVRQRASIGRLLFFDKILSGVEQTTCATCHHSSFMFGDGLTIARGVFCTMAEDGSQIFCEEPDDGDVVGPGRTAPLNERNTPSAVNSALFPRQMLNGRFHFVDDSSTDIRDLDPTLGFQVQQPEGVLFTRSLLAAQAFKPTPSAVEMAGDFPDPGQPFRPHGRVEAIQTALAERVNANPAYRAMFEEAYATPVFDGDPVIGASDAVDYLAVADAMAHFEEQDLVLTDAPWDAFLLGDDDAISRSAKRGAWVFFTRGKCVQCHSGDLFSDFDNYNLGVPQIGPGTGQSDDSDPAYRGLTTWDFGLEEVTGDRADRFKFRTSPLRGVALTAPFMHNGAFADLGDSIRHHVHPRSSYARYDLDQIDPEVAAVDGLKPARPVFDRRKNPVVTGPGMPFHARLRKRDIRDLVAFLEALTDPRMLELDALAPSELPSGLPPDVVDD